jgi:hypothetical protein
VNFVWDFSKFTAAAILGAAAAAASTRVAVLVPLTLSYEHVLMWVLALALTAPLWMVPLAFVACIGFMRTPIVLAPLHDFITRKVFDPTPALIVMSLSTYQLLDWRRYRIGFFYFGIYSVPILTITVVVLFYTFAIRFGVYDLAGFRILWLLPAALLIHALLLRPYAFLVAHSVKLPSFIMQLSTVRRLDQLLPDTGNKSTVDSRALAKILAEWKSVRAQLVFEERMAFKCDRSLVVFLLSHRAALFATRRFRERLEAAVLSAEQSNVAIRAARQELAEIEAYFPLSMRYRSPEVAAAIGLEVLRRSVEAENEAKKQFAVQGTAIGLAWCTRCEMRVWPTGESKCPSCSKSLSSATAVST